MSYFLMTTFRAIKSRLSIVILTMLIIVIAILSGCKKSNTEPPPLGTSEPLRFVFLADSRGDSLEHPVNLPVLTAIIARIDTLSPKPSFVIFGGDMSYRGWIHNSYTFQAWKNLFKPLTDSGIILYAAIGNHELYHEHASYGSYLSNQQEFQNVFSESPANGPAGYEHLAYSFTDDASSSFFAVLDPYYINPDSVSIHDSLGGHIYPAQMSWLQAQVAQTNALHKFLFIHVPYYYVSNDPEESSSADTTLTKLWAFIDANKFDFYACGHSHLFSRRTVDGSVAPHPQTNPPTPQWQNNVVQLLNGAAGAGPSTDSIPAETRAAWNVHNKAQTYYFTVVDVSGSTVTVNSYEGYTGDYTVFDTFTINK